MLPVLKQTWTVSAVLLNMFAQGMLLSYTSSLLPALRAPDSDIQIDLNTASWLASCVGIAGIPGFFISAFLMNWRGRKQAHAIVLIPGLIGWLILYFANDVTTLAVGRVLGGFTAGATVSLGAVVIGEYTSPNNRGTFLNLKTASVCLGGLVMHILGTFYHWRIVALMTMVPYSISLAIICTWPESPAWLASKKKYESSEKAFKWLRGNSEESRKELHELIQAQKEKPVTTKKMTVKSQLIQVLLKFTKSDFIKPLKIIIVSGILIEACGRHIFPAYASQIISEVTGDTSQSFYYTLGIDIIITGSATFSSVLVKIYKRRTLLFTSGFSALFVLFSVCAYLYLESKNVISSGNSIIPVVLFVIYFVSVNLGCTAIPLALCGEVWPLAHRDAGTAISGLVLSLAVLIGLQVTPHLLESIKVYGTFAVFGSVMGLALVILYFILPETKDRTLQEIEEYFIYGRYRDEHKTKEEAKMNVASEKLLKFSHTDKLKMNDCDVESKM
ncbi:facilitated trehalose transporter Tret1 [Papilio machaon]|uniref:facilitated trehalose transporter Tret1 n=1 Tax=Papilio machaon TaxID=76193 RepID=UPI001E666145|nr:facilitated trehalose transporter Tret1 [Papilio machaon]